MLNVMSGKVCKTSTLLALYQSEKLKINKSVVEKMDELEKRPGISFVSKFKKEK